MIKQVPRFAWVVVAVLVTLAMAMLFVWLGYTRDWVGFGYYVDSTGGQHPAKTLWDWMGLIGGLVVTTFIAYIGFHLSSQQGQIADDRNRETTLQNYLDKMTDLLLEKKLANAEALSEVCSIARARTVTALRQLDATRRNLLLGFLHQTDLIECDDGVRILHRADLSKADLSETDLSEVDLYGANLRKAKLDDADLFYARLQWSSLDGADLSRADLRGADLSGADLRGADLSGANLGGANLGGAKLGGAKLNGVRYQSETQWPEKDFTPPPEAIEEKKYVSPALLRRLNKLDKELEDE